MQAPISEIFCSVQGEGPYVGTRQVFVRFSGCNLSCPYCDTPQEIAAQCRFEPEPGTFAFEDMSNPLTAGKVDSLISGFNNIHSVSLTGGEPLLYSDFIKHMQTSYPLYLESNMTLPDAARNIRDKVAYVSGDIKIIDKMAGSELDNHLDSTISCFRQLRNTSERICFSKIVISGDTDLQLLSSVVDSISDYVSCVVLQPVTNSPDTADVRVLLDIQDRLLDTVDARIIPQTHKMLGCL